MTLSSPRLDGYFASAAHKHLDLVDNASSCARLCSRHVSELTRGVRRLSCGMRSSSLRFR